MSLKEVILDIADDMDKEAEDFSYKKEVNVYEVSKLLKDFSKQIKIACKASGDQPVSVQNPPVNVSSLIYPELQHRIQIEKAKEEFSKKKKSLNIEDSLDGDLVSVVNGPADNSFHQIETGMPIGAYTLINGAVYQLRKNEQVKQLEYDEVQTKQYNFRQQSLETNAKIK